MFVFMKTVFANLGIECQLQFKQNIGITLQVFYKTESSYLTGTTVIGLVENPAHWTLVDAKESLYPFLELGKVIVNQFEAMAAHGPLGGEVRMPQMKC
ncbi:hypothetical protein Peur_039319 [Populus x canadensis]